MMAQVDPVIIGLRETDRNRLQQAEGAVQPLRGEIRRVDEVMRDAVYVPRDGNGIDTSEQRGQPERPACKSDNEIEIEKDVGDRGQDGGNIPLRMSKDLHSPVAPTNITP